MKSNGAKPSPPLQWYTPGNRAHLTPGGDSRHCGHDRSHYRSVSSIAGNGSFRNSPAHSHSTSSTRLDSPTDDHGYSKRKLENIKIRSTFTAVGLLVSALVEATNPQLKCAASPSTSGSEASDSLVTPAPGASGSAGGFNPGADGTDASGGLGMGGNKVPRIPPAKVLDVVLPTAACSDLTSVDLTEIGGDGSSITSATETISSNITYCAVTGQLSTNITFTVLLPTATWTQHFQFTGCGGLCGQIGLARGSTDSSGEFAMASTDTAGGSDGTFGLIRDPRINFAYHANHWVTIAAKQFIQAYYGQGPEYSYFTLLGRWSRGRHGGATQTTLTASSPVHQRQNTLHHAWLAKSSTANDGTHPLLSAKLSVIHSAVVDACDELDGVKDGLLSEPRICKFDLKTLECESGATNTTSCLTATELGIVQKIYQGPVDEETGDHLTVGEAQFGSELSWSSVFVLTSSTGSLMSESAALAALRYLAFENSPGASYPLPTSSTTARSIAG